MIGCTTPNYGATYFVCALTFAHLFFAALTIAARPAAGCDAPRPGARSLRFYGLLIHHQRCRCRRSARVNPNRCRAGIVSCRKTGLGRAICNGCHGCVRRAPVGIQSHILFCCIAERSGCGKLLSCTHRDRIVRRRNLDANKRAASNR